MSALHPHPAGSFCIFTMFFLWDPPESDQDREESVQEGPYVVEAL